MKLCIKIMVAPTKKKMRDSYPIWFRPSNKITRPILVGVKSAIGGLK